MNILKECPICEKEITSDATIAEFCALCGMQIELSNCTVSRTSSSTKYYCGKKCYDKYRTFHPIFAVIQIV